LRFFFDRIQLLLAGDLNHTLRVGALGQDLQLSDGVRVVGGEDPVSIPNVLEWNRPTLRGEYRPLNILLDEKPHSHSLEVIVAGPFVTTVTLGRLT